MTAINRQPHFFFTIDAFLGILTHKEPRIQKDGKNARLIKTQLEPAIKRVIRMVDLTVAPSGGASV